MNYGKNSFEALFFISEDVQNNVFKKKGIACAVYFKEQIFLLTSSSVIGSKGNSKKLIAERFSRKHFGDYRLEVSLFRKLGNFTLLKIDKGNEIGEKGRGWVIGLHPESPSSERKALASPFCGTQNFAVELKGDGNNTNIEVISRKAIQRTSILGAPIIVENKHTKKTQSVIGVVGLNSEKKLCPCYLDENRLGKFCLVC